MNMAVRTAQQRPVDYTHCFHDHRLEVRGNDIAAEMLQKETVILNRLAESSAALVGSCRFLQNPRVSLDALREEATLRCAEAAQGCHVLAIQDTSEMNYQAHAANLSREDPDVGPVGNTTDIGFFLHPMLVVDAEDGFPLGVSDLFLWNRPWNQPTKDVWKYKRLPIEQKESFWWISCGQVSKNVLSEAASVTIIADREADIYEEFVALPDERTYLLIRSLQNRCLLEQDEKLFEHLGNQPVRGTYPLDIPTGHFKRQARTATIEVRWTSVNLARPQNAPQSALPDSVQVVAIEARELSSSVSYPT